MHATPRPRRAGARAAALAALTIAGGALTAPAAVAVPMAPGDNGTVKIHSAANPRTPVGDPKDEPKVCSFYIDAAHFDDLPDGQNITWTIETQPLDPNGATLSGEITLNPDGTGHTEDIVLPDDQYKLVWNIEGGSGAGKQKVFRVDCVATPSPSPSVTTAPPPHGGPPAGGGGVARDAAVGPVVGAAAVGLAAAGGAVWFRLRRRSHGTA
ncbi:hypothetical protein [Streptomyces sp. NEAU-NA10]|uniref:hypothetical protein n=1 Tax=Streptomyces sp. NEAU-NA10 TaxID=3416050 RepID=UPI003CC516D3